MPFSFRKLEDVFEERTIFKGLSSKILRCQDASYFSVASC